VFSSKSSHLKVDPGYSIDISKVMSGKAIKKNELRIIRIDINARALFASSMAANV
jgi:hypothetical protein